MPTVSLLALLSHSLLASAALSANSLTKHTNVLDLGFSFNPVKPAYWTSLPHHRRTPFSVTLDGKTAYLAYLDASETDVHVIQVDPTTFAAIGSPVTITGAKEAGGLVAQDDGFALLTNIDVPNSGTKYPIAVLIRYRNGKEAWRTFLGGPGVHADFGLGATPDLNGDLVYSYHSQLYGAYFVITAYTGPATGHFGDSVEYVDDSGALKKIPESSSWGCSHNTGIAFEAAASPPFASICAEDHGSIWLNTATRGMSGVKIAGENVTNGASGEPMGGMSGSYSALAKFPQSPRYIFAWATRGCVDLTADAWMGKGFTQCKPRTLNHNVGIAVFSDEYTLVGPQASSTVGAADGDSNINFLTRSTTVDHSNVHVATFDSSTALVTWEVTTNPSCTNVAMGCSGTFAGTGMVEVDENGHRIGGGLTLQDVYVSGDMTLMDYAGQPRRICWPYVDTAWDLSKPVDSYAPTNTVTKMSFACVVK